jgi:hypothetical protein
MKMGTGKGSGMGTGTGKGALYILQGVGTWIGTATGMGVGWVRSSVWVDLWQGWGRQLTPYTHPLSEHENKNIPSQFEYHARCSIILRV